METVGTRDMEAYVAMFQQIVGGPGEGSEGSPFGAGAGRGCGPHSSLIQAGHTSPRPPARAPAGKRLQYRGFEHEQSHEVGVEWDDLFDFNLGTLEQPDAEPHPYQTRNQSSLHSAAATVDYVRSHVSLPPGAVQRPAGVIPAKIRSISEPGARFGCKPIQSGSFSKLPSPARALFGDAKMSGITDQEEGVAGAVQCGDIPPDLLPSILERVTRKGKGGRQPAADPRTLPGVDPKRAKRIIANRESAARSKLKQKVLMETLKTRQDVLVTQRMTAQEELDLLRRMCRDLQSKNAQLEARIKMLESSRAHASQCVMDVDRDQAGPSGSGLASASPHNPSLSLDDQTLAGISTLASMAACRERSQPPPLAQQRHSPQLWTPSIPGEPPGASRDTILEVLQAQHLQAQQQQQQKDQQAQHLHPQQQEQQEQKAPRHSKAGSRQASVSRPQPQLLQPAKDQSPFFSSRPFGSPDPTAPPSFSSVWPAFSAAPPCSAALESILKTFPGHPGSSHPPSSGAMDIVGRSSGQVWPTPSLITPALAPPQPRRSRDPNSE
eukprot:gene640-2076_t